jgi:hypothetical protein
VSGPGFQVLKDCEDPSVVESAASRQAWTKYWTTGCARCAVNDHSDVVPVLEQAAGQLRDRRRGTGTLARGQLTRAYSLLLSMGRDTAGRDKPD